MNKRNCFIGQSGGPTAAINASLAGVIYECINCGEYKNVYGMVNGIKGLIEGKFLDLRELFIEEKNITKLRQTPAMYLGSCRYKLPTHEEDPQTYETLFNYFDEHEITDFFYIGGNDSMDTVAKLSAYASIIKSPIRFVGVPKTIDNDLKGTDHTPGFGSAAKYVATSMLEIAYDSAIYKLNSVTIVEIMGRNAGWLTAAAALARNENNDAPDLIYLPEVPFSKEKFLADIKKVFEKKRSVIIAVSEGIKDANGQYLDADSEFVQKDAFGHVIHSGTGKVLENLVQQEFRCKVRSIELNVLQRCAMHIGSAVDNDESFAIGREAVKAAMNGKTGVMMAFVRLSDAPYSIGFEAKDVSEIANVEQKIPVEWINDEHNDVTEELYTYLRPLIQGEISLQYENGIPAYMNVDHLK